MKLIEKGVPYRGLHIPMGPTLGGSTSLSAPHWGLHIGDFHNETHWKRSSVSGAPHPYGLHIGGSTSLSAPHWGSTLGTFTIELKEKMLLEKATLRAFGVSMIGRTPGSKSNVTMNAWLPQASYPCGNFSDYSSWIFLRPKGSIGHVFTVIRSMRLLMLLSEYIQGIQIPI